MKVDFLRILLFQYAIIGMIYWFWGGLFLIAAAVPIVLGARLFRRGPSFFLPAYLPFLALWNFQAVFSTAFLLYHRYLPRPGQLGFLLFNAVFLIPFHGATAILFADFFWKRLGRRLSWAAKFATAAPFVVVLVAYSRRAILRMAAEPAPSSIDVSAPASIKVMFLTIVAFSLAGILIASVGKAERRKKRVIPFAGLTVAGIALYLVSNVPYSGFMSFILNGFIWLAANVPAFIVLAIGARRERLDLAPRGLQISRLSEIDKRYRLSEREREILALACCGRLNQEIARELHISIETVKKHLYNVFKKTGVRNRIQLFLLISGEELSLPAESLKDAKPRKK